MTYRDDYDGYCKTSKKHRLGLCVSGQVMTTKKCIIYFINLSKGVPNNTNYVAS